MATARRGSAVTLKEFRALREEFVALKRKYEECVQNLDLQFKRIAQIQAELDHMRSGRSSSSKTTGESSPTPH
ncbi:MAG TPA: hypothetical protein VJ717_03810 [Gemmatimonadaceae bacterium]|nr:hypothetical protein [Gemmatimonadaceae bacterium]